MTSFPPPSTPSPSPPPPPSTPSPSPTPPPGDRAGGVRASGGGDDEKVTSDECQVPCVTYTHLTSSLPLLLDLYLGGAFKKEGKNLIFPNLKKQQKC